MSRYRFEGQITDVLIHKGKTWIKLKDPKNYTHKVKLPDGIPVKNGDRIEIFGDVKPQDYLTPDQVKVFQNKEKPLQRNMGMTEFEFNLSLGNAINVAKELGLADADYKHKKDAVMAIFAMASNLKQTLKDKYPYLSPKDIGMRVGSCLLYSAKGQVKNSSQGIPDTLELMFNDVVNDFEFTEKLIKEING